MIAATPQSAFDQVFDSLAECLTPEIAQRIVDIRLDPKIQARLDELAVKANEGTITAEEDAQYAAFIEAIDILGIFKAQARSILERRHR
jgi:hypothetical protein